MTNLEYIKSMLLDERNLAEMLDFCGVSSLTWRIHGAHDKWAERFGNKGNVVKENSKPSIWAFEVWHYPDGTKKKSGRNSKLSMQVWLGLQYNAEDWIQEEE